MPASTAELTFWFMTSLIVTHGGTWTTGQRRGARKLNNNPDKS
jgi:hypothetical protein